MDWLYIKNMYFYIFYAYIFVITNQIFIYTYFYTYMPKYLCIEKDKCTHRHIHICIYLICQHLNSVSDFFWIKTTSMFFSWTNRFHSYDLLPDSLTHCTTDFLSRHLSLWALLEKIVKAIWNIVFSPLGKFLQLLLHKELFFCKPFHLNLI